jgi:hypothetical protein
VVPLSSSLFASIVLCLLRSFMVLLQSVEPSRCISITACQNVIEMRKLERSPHEPGQAIVIKFGLRLVKALSGQSALLGPQAW